MLDGYINGPFSLQRSKLEDNTWVILDTNGFSIVTRQRADRDVDVRADEVNERIDAQMNFITNAMNAIFQKGMII